jgi:DNA helicase-2/ATP-dependent DNA helicase PcrA
MSSPTGRLGIRASEVDDGGRVPGRSLVSDRDGRGVVARLDQDKGGELFAVGDPDQAIFAFSGTKPQLLRELADRATVNDVSLEWNYRSPQKLIDAAIQHLGEERMARGRPDGGSIEAIECSGGFDHQLTNAQQLIAAERAVSALEAHLPVFARRDRGYRQTPATSLVEAMAAWSVQPRDGRGVQFADVIRRSRSVARRLADADCIDRDHAALPLDSRCPRHRFRRGDRCGCLCIKAPSQPWRRRHPGVRQDEEALKVGGALEGTTLDDLGLRARARDCLLISTVHGAKGLEFDVVIILEVEEGVMPFFIAKSPAQLAEERRTFYVAMTRARDKVCCLWSPWRQTNWGRRHDGPSPYLRALGLVR